MTTSAVSSLANSLFTMLNFLLPVLFLSGIVAILFRPAPDATPSLVFAAQNLKGWLWRILAALLAYPLIGGYYAAGEYELTIPTWGQIVPLQLARGLLFLLVSLPMLARWNGSRRSLWLSLGFAIFACTNFMAVITAYWFPWEMRLFHGLELLADGLLYVGALTWLFKERSFAEGSGSTLCWPRP